ncbi:type VI secretion system tube protein Hcp [Erwinia rhapontici]|uniref:Hcp family type VI secretion system effector n=1 Tax=Erwinia TaxID=551 RepID=UPI001438283E|nr:MULTISPECIES: type VI secretion system tube protein Hcp [Erwinia]NKG28715.1 type VI secretion system tube protein Hcp [Erwinia rhapontici]NNS09221.1 type VI secretion system tube protein Hcp [Erwinia sp. JH02]
MAQDMFIKINGVEGESLDFSHKGEIEVLRWNWSVAQPANMHSGSGGGAGKSTVHDLYFKHYIDRSSTNLIQYCLTGKHIPEAVLTVRKAGGSPLDFLKITLQELIITCVEPIGMVHMPIPIEKVGLCFSRVKFEYLPQSAEGKIMGMVAMGYDIKANATI